MSVVAVVPAAGRSERFGSLKLVADLDGEPLLNRTLQSLLDAGLAPIVVVLSPNAPLEAVTLLGHPKGRTVINADPSRGMFSSIQAGLFASRPDTILVLPADMPFVTSATIATVADTCARTDNVVVPVYQGRRGHPVALPGRLHGALLAVAADRSLKDGLAALGETLYLVDVDDAGVVRDVDTKEDLYRGISNPPMPGSAKPS